MNSALQQAFGAASSGAAAFNIASNAAFDAGNVAIAAMTAMAEKGAIGPTGIAVVNDAFATRIEMDEKEKKERFRLERTLAEDRARFISALQNDVALLEEKKKEKEKELAELYKQNEALMDLIAETEDGKLEMTPEIAMSLQDAGLNPEDYRDMSDEQRADAVRKDAIEKQEETQEEIQTREQELQDINKEIEFKEKLMEDLDNGLSKEDANKRLVQAGYKPIEAKDEYSLHTQLDNDTDLLKNRIRLTSNLQASA